MSLRIATRSSRLARVQAELVGRALTDSAAAGFELVPVETAGERGDKERFVRGVERELIDGRAEAAVHSAKDLPGTMTPGLAIAAVPAREDARDAWLGPGGSLGEIPAGTRVGTSSLRRRSQMLAARPDLVPVEFGGNVETRIAKLARGEVDGIVLAMAGLKRLGLEHEAAFLFSLEQMTPAAGQGALAVQTQASREASELVRPANDERAERELTAERAAVLALGADCSSPVGIHARDPGDRMVIEGFAGLPDGSKWVRDRIEGDRANPEELGRELARRMELAGAAAILAAASTL